MSKESRSFKKLQVIINPAAGVGRPILQALNAGLKDTGIDWDVSITHRAGDAERLAKEAVENGADVVGVHGGDGSVMEVASALRGTSTPLAIFPGGTANVMSVELGIPSSDIEASIDFIAKGNYTTRLIDMGLVNDRLFLLRIGIGLEADMMKSADQEIKNRFGVLAYAFSALSEMRNLTPSLYRVHVDGELHEIEGISCMIANSGNVAIGGLTLSKKIDISDGALDVVIFRRADLAAMITVSAAVVSPTAEATDSPQLVHYQGREIVVEADPPQTISIDGEVIEPTTLTASILPGAVNVVVPIPLSETTGTANIAVTG
ncbi:MAG TPA: diacylglycerol kinase family protein [Anaerolineales bacterium]|nr:diacylglycerol kinase family protein [Anaerolineales bacterium]